MLTPSANKATMSLCHFIILSLYSVEIAFCNWPKSYQQPKQIDKHAITQPEEEREDETDLPQADDTDR